MKKFEQNDLLLQIRQKIKDLTSKYVDEEDIANYEFEKKYFKDYETLRCLNYEVIVSYKLDKL